MPAARSRAWRGMETSCPNNAPPAKTGDRPQLQRCNCGLSPVLAGGALFGQEVSMPRQARLRAAGIPWHVRQRANNGIACFVEAEDRELYLGLLGELAPKAGCHVHAYVLMTNHTHLLVTPAGIDSVPRLMKHLGERYSRHFNQRRRRYGTLWEGRYRSSIVDSDAYLLTCYRYI